MQTLKDFNKLDTETASAELFKCCGSKRWVKQMMGYFPFTTEDKLFEHARTIWYNINDSTDYLEAFTHHPKIGDVKSLKEKFASTSEWAGNEQSGVKNAQARTIQELSELNEAYYKKFGFIFIVCATGKSAEEMLELLKTRIDNSKEEEIGLAMGEQFKITLLRLQKMVQLNDAKWNAVSQITTHVLDTSLGKPGKDIRIQLKKESEGKWKTIASGVTNVDGRIANLLPPGVELPAGNYVMHFNTGNYFEKNGVTGFYPQVDIHFTTFDQTHYHVPLLINPFGYSTYRGS